MNLFKSIRMRRDCTPENQRGRHGVVLTDCGGMGDGQLCLRCGLEGYFDFRKKPSQNCETARQINAPDDWPAMEAARNLPKGLNNA